MVLLVVLRDTITQTSPIQHHIQLLQALCNSIHKATSVEDIEGEISEERLLVGGVVIGGPVSKMPNGTLATKVRLEDIRMIGMIDSTTRTSRVRIGRTTSMEWIRKLMWNNHLKTQ